MTLFFNSQFHIWNPEKLNIHLQKISILFVPIWDFKMFTNESCSGFLLNRWESFQQIKHLLTLENKQSHLFCYHRANWKIVQKYFKAQNNTELVVAVISCWQLSGCWGFTLQWNALLLSDHDWPLSWRINGTVPGCPGKLRAHSLCDP
jgi:hypothetical protein